jgi:hypothetical protein
VRREGPGGLTAMGLGCPSERTQSVDDRHLIAKSPLRAAIDAAGRVHCRYRRHTLGDPEPWQPDPRRIPDLAP